MRKSSSRRLVLALVVVTFAFLLSLGLGPAQGSPVLAQDATPTPVTFPVSPEAGDCTVEARPLSDFEVLLTPQAEVTSAASSFVMPDGEPADAATVSGVTKTLLEMIACYQAGDPRRFHALFTDEGLLRSYPPGMVTQEFFDDFFAASPVPVDDPELRATLLAVEEVTMLPDDRVGALVRSDEPELGGPQATYFIFVEAGDRFLIDDVVHGLPTDPSSEESTPVP